ncbi:LPXTG cell wall anchor domain-containing protein [Lacticaseibacillus brantae]|uniref:Gram-positive cocci surface proteins LPxTG domain-containing protein n=1 Tax=Lacticaseibacillus brantae DSM 23927 TaxID=1423727 RepID=A0A0R2AY01_9LACO|nr:LPXTG cell wall anchor domain-containing protein [Lacticaseibacillus brantae]KRM71888.1 hypothetical protein FC34_GL000864 [Lacticaseibacillus brantae DSM 23927]
MKSRTLLHLAKPLFMLVGLIALTVAPIASSIYTTTINATTISARASDTGAYDPTTGYVLQIPRVNPLREGDTQVTGSLDISDMPAGTTATVTMSIPGLNPETSTVQADGSFSFDVAALTATAPVRMVANTTGAVSLSGIPITYPVYAAGSADDPLTQLALSTPHTDPLVPGATEITGGMAIPGDLPANNFLYMAATSATDSTATFSEALVDHDTGTFTVPMNGVTAAAGDVYLLTTFAANPDTNLLYPGKTIAVHVTDPWNNYTIAQPSLNPISAGDTMLSGHFDNQTNVPAGTTFSGSVTLPGGSSVPFTIGADGSFNITLPKAAQHGDQFTVQITATNNGRTQQASASVTAPALESPLANYQVPDPHIDGILSGQTTMTGNVDISTAPAGTNFTATVTLPNGSTQTVPVDAQGHFQLPIDPAVTGNQYTVVVTAENTGHTVTSNSASRTVMASHPLDNYTVSQPVLNPMTSGDTKVTGHVDISQAPANTSFMATLTLPNGRTQQVTVNADGSFTFSIPAAMAGDQYKVVITAQNEGFRKQSEPATTIVTAKATEQPTGNKPGHQPGQGNQNLPATSDAKSIGLVLAGVAVLLVSGGILIRKRRA